ncbi:MAG TPA: chromosomal replication initiator protein DnaA [Patescibacteria group bacterium]|nr:chromosomal replication initiator protein DnaA [Patescibacteria group bacterium]
MNPDTMWRAVLGELEVNLSKANFSTWFKNTFIYSIDDDRAVIGVPSNFYIEWLKKKYNLEILSALKKLMPQIQTVDYRVASKRSNETQIPEIKLDAIQPSPVSQAKETKMSADYHTFGNFVVGNSNKLAHAASLSVAEKPGLTYNPLFIWGGSGLGKTHLIQAVKNEITKRYPDYKILYVPCEKFTNDFILAVREGRGKAEQFKNKYRLIDALLVDDIQFIAGKEGTQEEFFHTFNALHQAKKQIILTSDRPPKEIPTLGNRLKSRFEWGLTCDIQAPDFEMRRAILQNKAQEKEFEITEDVADFIARNVQQNIRELEGALNKLIAHVQFYNLKPSVDVAMAALGNSISSKNKSLSFDKIVDTVAGFYNVQVEDLLGARRNKQIVIPRQIAMYLLRQELQYSYPQIAIKIGKKDHTTIMYGCEKIEKQIRTGHNIHKEIILIKEKLYM